MDKERIKGKAEDVAGRVERQVGEWTGNDKAQAEGLAKQAEGKARNAVGKTKDAVRDAADKLKETKSELEKMWAKKASEQSNPQKKAGTPMRQTPTHTTRAARKSSRGR